MAQVVLDRIYKSFPRGSLSSDGQSSRVQSTAVLRDISLTVKDGEFMVLVGPSGCGKSTLLRLIAGLEPLTGGQIYVGDRLVNDLPPKARDIAMVFQNYALYPHMTVFDNLAFGLRRTTTHPNPSRWASVETFLVELTRQWPKGVRYQTEQERAIAQRVQEVAQMLQLDTLLNRLPRQLSGGQKQRVALGRAMARSPQVFLMDEPLSNLDAKLRTETRSQIVQLQRQLGTTTIYVTHDQTEAMTMGDRITVLNAGQIQQIGTPLELYHHPANRFVAEFIGSPPMNFLSVQFRAPLTLMDQEFRLTLPEPWAIVLKPYDGQRLLLGIRPEHLSISLPAPKNLAATVEVVEALGRETYLTVQLKPGQGQVAERWQVRVDADRPVQVGEDVWLAIAPSKLHLFNPTTGKAIQPTLY